MMGKHRKGTVVPRETIFVPYPNDPASGPPPFQVQVGWQTDQDVQLGVVAPDARHLVDYIYGDVPTQTDIGRALWRSLLDRLPGPRGEDALAVQLVEPLDFRNADEEAEFYNGLGRAVLDAVTGSTPFGTSVWATLPRHPINQLVRLLRKARDSAYGADA